jgi:hypothetical protein
MSARLIQSTWTSKALLICRLGAYLGSLSMVLFVAGSLVFLMPIMGVYQVAVTLVLTPFLFWAAFAAHTKLYDFCEDQLVNFSHNRLVALRKNHTSISRFAGEKTLARSLVVR